MSGRSAKTARRAVQAPGDIARMNIEIIGLDGAVQAARICRDAAQSILDDLAGQRASKQRELAVAEASVAQSAAGPPQA